MANSQLYDLRHMRVLLEEARALARNLAYHRRVRLEEVLGRALAEVDTGSAGGRMRRVGRVRPGHAPTDVELSRLLRRSPSVLYGPDRGEALSTNVVEAEFCELCL